MPVNIQEREGDGERRTARGDTAEADVFRCPCLISHVSCATGQMDLMHREQCLRQIQIRVSSKSKQNWSYNLSVGQKCPQGPTRLIKKAPIEKTNETSSSFVPAPHDLATSRRRPSSLATSHRPSSLSTLPLSAAQFLLIRRPPLLSKLTERITTQRGQ